MPSPATAAFVRSEAARILTRNRRVGHADWNGQDYAYVVPSPGSYPFQWFWDSCFHAIALTHINPDWAREELLTLLHGAQPDGFIPHQILWEKDRYPEAAARQSEDFGDRYASTSIQPPVLAVAIERVYRATGDAAFLARALPPTIAFHRWLADIRDPDGDGLIAIIQPDESGIDASPKFDPLMDYPKDNDDLVRWIAWLYGRYAPLRLNDRAILDLDLFNVEEVLTNVFHILGMQAVARLTDDPAVAAEFTARAAQVRDALIEKCWDEDAGAFFDLAGREERPLRVLTIASLAPLALPDLPRPIVGHLVAHLRDPETFALPYPVPLRLRARAVVHARERARLHLARAELDQQQLADRRGAARARHRRSARAPDRRDLHAGRARGIPRVLPPLHRRGVRLARPQLEHDRRRYARRPGGGLSARALSRGPHVIASAPRCRLR